MLIKTKKKIKHTEEYLHKKMCYAIMAWIEAKGGSALVMGGIKIRQRPPLKFNHTFEIDFTGKAPKSNV